MTTTMVRSTVQVSMRLCVACSCVLPLLIAVETSFGGILADIPFAANSGPPQDMSVVIPGPGHVTFTWENPDASPGGRLHFSVSFDDGPNELFEVLVNGFSDGAAYMGNYEIGAEQRVFKFPVERPGARIYNPSYSAANNATGTDRLIIEYSSQPIVVPPAGDSPRLSISSAASEPNSVYGDYSSPTAGFLLVHTTVIGHAGGGYGIYIDGRAAGFTVFREPSQAHYLLDAPAGTHDIHIAHEDDYWGDNGGTRAADVYFITIPEPCTVNLIAFGLLGLLAFGRYRR